MSTPFSFSHADFWPVALFAQLTSTVKMGAGVVSGWTVCDTNTDF